MKIKEFFKEFFTIFIITLVVTIIVTLIWNLLFHNSISPNWETSFQLAILFGIIIPLSKLKS